MSTQPTNPNTKKKNGGYMIANDRKNDRQPHFRGKVSLEGKEFLVSAWQQEPRDGKAMFSIELTDPATLPPAGAAQPRPQAQQEARGPSPASPAAPSAARQSAPPSSSPPPPGEDKAFDDIFGGDGSQW